MPYVFKGLSAEDYATTLSAGFFSDKEARAEYARLRRVANKRLARMEKAGFSTSRTYKLYGEGFESLYKAKIETVREQLADVAHFLGLKTSTITGQRNAVKKAVATMQANGYDAITAENYDQWGRFMQAAIDHYGKKSAFDSERIYEMFERAEKSPITPEKIAEDFDYWYDHTENIPVPEMTEADRVK